MRHSRHQGAPPAIFLSVRRSRLSARQIVLLAVLCAIAALFALHAVGLIS